MPQKPAPGRDPIREGRASLIQRELTRQGFTHRQAVIAVNYQLKLLGYPEIGREHFSKLAAGAKPLTESNLRGIAAALGLREAVLRNPVLAVDQAA